VLPAATPAELAPTARWKTRNVALDHGAEHRKPARVEVEVGFVVLADLGDEAAKRLELLAGARILSLRTQPLCDNLLGSLVCNL
jgi:hypothetical protein